MKIKILHKNYLELHINDFISILKKEYKEYWGKEHFLSDLKGKWKYSIYAEKGEKLVGYIIASDKGDIIHIHKIMVHPEHRGSGIGSKLLKFFEENCKKNNRLLISLKVYKILGKSINFYQKHGFSHYKEQGELLEMRKELKLIVGIHQPNFLPWLGYFSKMYLSDIFIFMGNVQFTKRSYINRTQIKTAQGARWLTVPVKVKNRYYQKIHEVEIVNEENWQKKILNSFKRNYHKAKAFEELYEYFASLLTKDFGFLQDLNICLIKTLAKKLGIITKFVYGENLNLNGQKSELIVQMVESVGGNAYIYGQGGKKYQDESLFKKHGIELIDLKYQHPIYPQLFGDFVEGLSISDALFNLGFDGCKRLIQKI